MGLTSAERLAEKNAFDASLVYGTKAFNTATGRDQHLKRREAIRERFIEPATGLLRRDISQTRPGCPVCSASDRTALFVKEGFPHHRCVCGMVYVDPIVRQEVLDEYYTAESSYTQVLRSELQIHLDRLKYRYGLDRIESYVPSPRVLLDIGCGPGFFLEEAQARGWEVAGVEFNELSVARLRELGFPVITDPFPIASVPVAAYDAVTAWDVLEHIPNPAAFVRGVRKALKPGGVMLVCVPNIDSLVNRILHEKSGTFAGYAHINFFNARTLSALMESCGFRVCEYETIVTELDTIHNYLGYDDPYFGDSPAVLDCLSPAYLHDHLLGSQLLLVARKMQEESR